MELRTSALTRPQLQEEISVIIDLLRAKGKLHLLVSYGWDCDLEADHLYQGKPLPLSGLPAFLSSSEDQGIFTLGENDLLIECADHSIEFTLCHESDIHMMTEDMELATEIQRAWASKGYSPYEVSLS